MEGRAPLGAGHHFISFLFYSLVMVLESIRESCASGECVGKILDILDLSYVLRVPPTQVEQAESITTIDSVSLAKGDMS